MVYFTTKWEAKQPKSFMYMVYIRITVRLQTAFVQEISVEVCLFVV